VQVALVYLGGAVFGCYGLNAQEWLAVVAAAALIIPVDIIRKAVLSGTSLKA
jgi:hypothetical protein